jgi:hypothetical protein
VAALAPDFPVSVSVTLMPRAGISPPTGGSSTPGPPT